MINEVVEQLRSEYDKVLSSLMLAALYLKRNSAGFKNNNLEPNPRSSLASYDQEKLPYLHNGCHSTYQPDARSSKTAHFLSPFTTNMQTTTGPLPLPVESPLLLYDSQES